MENELKEFNFEKDEIKLDNSIVEKAIGTLNQNPFSLFMFLCADFSRENLIETPDLFKLTIRNSDFLNSIGYVANSGYTDVKRYFKELQQTVFEIPKWDKGELAGDVITGLILKSVTYKKGTTTVWIAKELAPYYYTMKVERDRTITRYNLLKAFNSEFSSKIYFSLVRWKSVRGKKVVFGLDELKEKLGVSGKYKDFKEFNRCILEVSKKEINQKSDIIMDYKKLALGESKGKGRKPITHIEFSFVMKNQQNDIELLSEKQIRELMELAEKRTYGSDRTAKEFYDYALALTLEKCINNKGFFKYIKNVIKNDTSFLGQISMFTNPDVRAATQQKTIEVQNNILREKKEKREQALAEHDEIERLFKEGKI